MVEMMGIVVKEEKVFVLQLIFESFVNYNSLVLVDDWYVCFYYMLFSIGDGDQ